MRPAHHSEQALDLFLCKDGWRPLLPLEANGGDFAVKRQIKNITVDEDNGLGEGVKSAVD